MKNNKGFETLCAKDPLIENLNSHTLPIYATSTFIYKDLEQAQGFFSGKNDCYVYSRLGNPTVDAVADKIAQLESFDCFNENGSPIVGKGFLLASGMAAISTAILSAVKAGDKILIQGNLYGTTNELINDFLLAYNIHSQIIDLKDLDLIENLIVNDESIKLIYIETPANPTLECYDLEGLSNIAKAYNVTTIVDNTFATPYLQRPISKGIDIVVHSSTKYLNGHGTGMSGAIVVKSDSIYAKSVKRIIKLFGAVCSPIEAFLLNNGIKTLPLRMKQHEYNAKNLSDFLLKHEKVKNVIFLGIKSHPSHLLSTTQMIGYGGMLSFDIDGDVSNVNKFLKNLQICSLTASLGTADTLISNPATMSHVNVPIDQRNEYGITDTLIRVSVGLENSEDIIDDINQALLGAY
jgi:methionine-gamma-lyase